MSNSPTPPAQDGERITCPYCVIVCKCGYEREIARDTAIQKRIDTDAQTIRTQSAELAALRAQVEGLRTRFRAAFLYQTKDELAIHIKTDGLDLSFIKPGTFKEGCWTELLAALASPQPVAKETKP